MMMFISEVKDKFKYLFMCVLLATSCGDSTTIVGNDDDDDDPPPPPSFCDGFYEYEPNNLFEEANFVDILPILSPNNICAVADVIDLQHGGDVFYFALQPTHNSSYIETNWVLDIEEDVLPYIEFYQSYYNSDGTVKDINLIGTFFGEHGRLEVLNFTVEYEFLVKRDLYVVVKGIIPLPLKSYPYELNYWNH